MYQSMNFSVGRVRLCTLAAAIAGVMAVAHAAPPAQPVSLGIGAITNKTTSAPTTKPSATTTPGKPPHLFKVVLSPAAQAAQIKQLIQDLNSDHYNVRHAAKEELLAMGDSAMPTLKKALQGLTTPEMRHLMRQIIRTVANADLLRGPLITLNTKNMSAQDVFQSVCHQAHTTDAIFQQTNLPNLTVRETKAPFWKVMQRLAVLTGVSPGQFYNNTPGLNLSLNGALHARDIVSYQGAFAVVVQNLTHTQSVDFSQVARPTTDSFMMNLWLLSIPGHIGPLQPQQPVISKAVDSLGHNLAPPPAPNPQQFWYGNQMTNGVYNCNLMLNWPAKQGKVIRTLTGYIPVMASMGKKVLILKFKPKGMVRASFRGVRMEVENLKQINGNWQFTCIIKAPASQGFNLSPATQNIVNQMQNFNNGNVYGAAHKVLNNAGCNGGGQWTRLVYTATVNGGKPVEIRMPIFTRQKLLKIPFSFKNIPMP